MTDEPKKPDLSATMIAGKVIEQLEAHGKRPSESRPTLAMKIFNTIVEDVVRIVAGLIAMGGGGWLVMYEAKLPKDQQNTILLIAGLVAFTMGFCLMPYVFTKVKQIVIFVFPNGIPLPGGRRASDPPASKPEDTP